MNARETVMTRKMDELKDKMNTIFEQDGRVYAICANSVPPKDLAKFIRGELVYGTKHIPRFQMRVITTDEFRKMPFGKPLETVK